MGNEQSFDSSLDGCGEIGSEVMFNAMRMWHPQMTKSRDKFQVSYRGNELLASAIRFCNTKLVYGLMKNPRFEGSVGTSRLWQLAFEHLGKDEDDISTTMAAASEDEEKRIRSRQKCLLHILANTSQPTSDCIWTRHVSSRSPLGVYRAIDLNATSLTAEARFNLLERLCMWSNNSEALEYVLQSKDCGGGGLLDGGDDCTFAIFKATLASCSYSFHQYRVVIEHILFGGNSCSLHVVNDSSSSIATKQHKVARTLLMQRCLEELLLRVSNAVPCVWDGFCWRQNFAIEIVGHCEHLWEPAPCWRAASIEACQTLRGVRFLLAHCSTTTTSILGNAAAGKDVVQWNDHLKKWKTHLHVHELADFSGARFDPELYCVFNMYETGLLQELRAVLPLTSGSDDRAADVDYVSRIIVGYVMAVTLI